MKLKTFFSFVIAMVLVLGLTMTAFAQTAGEPSSDDDFSDGGTLDTGNGSATVPSGTAQRGRLDPVGQDDLDDLGGTGNSPPPAGQSFLSEGITLNLWDDAGPLSSFPHAVKVCFPAPPGGATIRFWDATNEIWQVFPTFADSGQLCTFTTVPGTFALTG